MRLSRKAGLLHTHAYIDQSEYLFDDDVNKDQHYYKKTCSCGKAITVWEDHEPTTGYRAATCTGYGYSYKRCKTCKKEYYYYTYNPTGHNYVFNRVTQTAYCESFGEEEYICSNCGASDIRIIPELGHDYQATTVAATCTERGYKQHTCTRCGDSYNDSYTSALGHAMVYTGLYDDEGYVWKCTRPGCNYTEIRANAGL